MKKTVALILAALMLLSFASCGTKEVVNGIVENVAEKSNEKITSGEINGEVYSSEYSELTFTKGETWVYATDDELVELMNVGIEDVNLDEFSKNLAELGTVYDMMASDTVTGSSVMVMYENLDVTNIGTGLSASEYLDVIKETLPEQTGMPYEFTDEETVTLSGNDYLRATFSVAVEGVSITQAYYLRALDDVMCCVIVTPLSGVTFEDIEAMFS